MGREIRGLIFIIAAVVLAASLLSFDPADRLLWTATGPLGDAQNLLGTLGAHLAGGLFLLVGFSAFWLVAVLLVLAFFSFLGHPLKSASKNILAVLVLMASFAGLLNLELPETVAFKGGGLVGLYLGNQVKGFLNHFGATIFFLSIFLISLMVLTRLSLGRLLSAVASSLMGIARRIGEIFKKRRERKRRALKTQPARDRLKKKPKTVVIQKKKPPPKRPAQERFEFMNTAGGLKLPQLDILNDPPESSTQDVHRDSLEMNARRLQKKLADFGVEGEVSEILPGPVITMYEYKPAPGIKISKVAGLADDLALTLRAQSIRIVAPIPGKAAIGIEIPNNQREMVVLKEILSSPAFTEAKHDLPIALGKDITGEPVVTDLARMPHLLVAGATGAGKSVSLNAMIISLLYKVSPEMARFIIIDPKRIELSIYDEIPHLLHPVVTEPKDATRALKWAVKEMERRYVLLSELGVRNIITYNRKLSKEKNPVAGAETEETLQPLPYIILVIDELADLMMASSREVEEAITRLAQMARAAGIHLIIATQRPSVDVLTGIIKANFPTRISFQVSSRVDSRTILDAMGAETLLGEGDMLFMPPGVGRIKRIHGAFVSEEEVKAVTDFLRAQKKPLYNESILSEMAREETMEEDDAELDEKFDLAVEIVANSGQASISMLQRKLRVGYNRAARMIEAMEREGIVGPSDGVRPRKVFGRREDA
ncbi:MAG: DNA translocase FtsK 4TM domain-containing protein [Deltaproteobacteria bacterium]|nr:DNA translocase FtsK 4TM domain-containing protein [Deltaproteobacteria bacterium]